MIQNVNRTNMFFCCISILFLIGNVKARLEGEGIVGGDDAKEGDYPYQVSIQVFGKHICGGSIIGKNHIVTAAHCVIDEYGEFNGTPLRIVAGAANLKGAIKTMVAIDAQKVYALESYDPTSKSSFAAGDIAVLKLKKDFPFESNPSLAAVNLPDVDKNYADVIAVATGFGYNKIDVVFNPKTNKSDEANGVSYNKMRFAEAKVITNEVCQKPYKSPVTDNHICANILQRDPKKPEGLCGGDSGSPLVHENTLIGVVSASPLGCHEDKIPAVYTRVSSFVDFIKNAIEDNVTDDMRTVTLKMFG